MAYTPIANKEPITGNMQKTDNSVVNVAELLVQISNALLTGKEASVDSGIATGGSISTVVDTSRNWQVNVWAGALMEVQHAGIGYIVKIVSNTVNTITFTAAIAQAVSAGDTYDIKLPVQTATLAASDKFVGRSGAQGFKASASFNIPSGNTTTYTIDVNGTAGDAISDSTAILSYDLAADGAAPGQMFSITNARVVSSVKPAGAILNANIHIYSVNFGVTTDNAELSIDDTTANTGGISIPCLNGFQTALNSKCTSDPGQWMGKLAANDTKIYFELQAANAYTPVSGETFTVILEGVLL